jgi:hypothetical protein
MVAGSPTMICLEGHQVITRRGELARSITEAGPDAIGADPDDVGATIAVEVDEKRGC